MKETMTNYENWFQDALEDPEIRLAFDRERASMEFTEQLEHAMAAGGLSRADVARQLGRSRAFVSQALRRGQNLTIKTMAELSAACGFELHILLRRRSHGGGSVFCAPMVDWEELRRPSKMSNIAVEPASAVSLGSSTPDDPREAAEPWTGYSAFDTVVA